MDQIRQNSSSFYHDLSRRDTRSLIFHFLYAAESFDYQESLLVIFEQFERGFDVKVPVDGDLFRTVESIIDQKDRLDQLYKPLLINWRFERVSVCSKLILRFALWEFLNTDTDKNIIINEAIELAKSFAEHDSYRFINGILDAIAQQK